MRALHPIRVRAGPGSDRRLDGEGEDLTSRPTGRRSGGRDKSSRSWEFSAIPIVLVALAIPR